MNKAFILNTLRKAGKTFAEDLQNRAAEMTGTEINAEAESIPTFASAVKTKNMLHRPIGFICKTTAGRIVKLLQNYDSAIFTAEPEDLSAQWGFVWSQDPEKALPFIPLSTSPYGKGDCCTEDGKTYRSVIGNNVFSPSAYPQGWEEIV